MAKIVITRSSDFNNRLRSAAIYLDGEKIGAVANGEVRDFQVPEGLHRISAKINWGSSREISFMVKGTKKNISHYRVINIQRL